jgi:hypothetical protein
MTVLFLEPLGGGGLGRLLTRSEGEPGFDNFCFFVGEGPGEASGVRTVLAIALASPGVEVPDIGIFVSGGRARFELGVGVTAPAGIGPEEGAWR